MLSTAAVQDSMWQMVAARKGKLITAVALLAVAGGVYWYTSRERPVLPERITLVCVATGKTYQLRQAEVKYLPAKNPETGQETLLPVWDDNGTLRVKERYKSALKDSGVAAQNKFVDPKTLEVKKG